MLYGECRKIFGNKTVWLIVGIALICNMAMLIRFTPAGAGNSGLAYSEHIQSILETAEYKLEEYRSIGYADTSFVRQYQTQVIRTYAKLAEQPVDKNASAGWQMLFSYSGGAIFLIVCAFLCGFLIFYADRFSGMTNILRTTRNGRTKSAIVKVVVCILTAGCLTSLFEFSEILLTVAKNGYTSAYLPIQSVPGMELCPFVLTIGEGLVLRYGIHLCVCIVVMFLSGLLTSACNSYLTVFSGGILLFVFQYLQGSTSFLNAYNYFNIVNIFKIYNLHFVKNFSAVKFGEACIPSDLVLLYTFAVLAAISSIWIVIFYSRRRYKHGSARRMDAVAKMLSVCAKGTKRAKNALHVSITGHELYKTYGRGIVLCVGVFYCISSFMTWSAYFAADTSYADNRYKQYMIEIEGEPTDEKVAYIDEKISYAQEIIAKEKTMQELYAADAITSRAYNAYQIEYYACMDELPILLCVQERIKSCNAARTLGYDAMLLYDTGWILYFSRNVDYSLCIALCLILAGVFSSESESGILPIVRATKYGRKKLLGRKYAVALLGCFVGWCINEVSVIVWCTKNYYMPSGNASIYSLNNAVGHMDMTIYEYMLFTASVHLIGWLMLGILVTSASVFIKRTYVVVAFSVILYCIHPILNIFAIDIRCMPDIVLASPPANAEICVAWCIVSLALLAFSTIRYCGHVKEHVRIRRDYEANH